MRPRLAGKRDATNMASCSSRSDASGRRIAAKTAQRRRQLAQSRGKPPMFDRGAYFEAEKRRGRIKYPEGWLDPDVGWYANSVREADAGSDRALGA